MIKEIWKDIDGYIGIYKISNYGRVKSLRRLKINGQFTHITKEKVLVPIKKSIGYIQNTLVKNGKSERVLVHRLVAQAFIPNPLNKPQINHKDGNGFNNNVENLEWCNASENGLHSYRVLGNISWTTGKFSKNHPTSKEVIQKSLDGKIIRIWDSGMDAVRSGFTSSEISRCCNGERKTHKGFRWELKINNDD